MTVLVETIARLLLLPLFVVAAGFLVAGYRGTGDGFSAGVVAATGLFLQDIVFGFQEEERLVPVRWAYAAAGAGLLIVILFVFAPTLWGMPLLTHYPPPGEEVFRLGALELHTSLLFDAGVFLVVLGSLVVVMTVVADVARRGQS